MGLPLNEYQYLDISAFCSIPNNMEKGPRVRGAKGSSVNNSKAFFTPKKTKYEFCKYIRALELKLN